MSIRQRWSPERIEQELKDAMNILGLDHLPSATDLKSIGKQKLAGAMYNNGGIGHWSKILDVPTASDVKWRTDEDVLQAIQKAMEELGIDRLPTHNELANTKHSWLIMQMHKRGGSRAMAEKLGVAAAQGHYKKAGWWDNWVNIENELRKAMVAINTNEMPTISELEEYNFGGLVNALYRHGGMYKCAERANIPINRKQRPKGWWTTDRIRNEIQPVVNELGRMPTKGELDNRGLTDVSSTISDRGYEATATKLGLKMKDCKIRRAIQKEREVNSIIQDLGLDSELTSYKAPYDILVNETLRIDVKMGSRTQSRNKQFMFRMDNIDNPNCDLYVLFTSERETGETVDVYWVPADMMPLLRSTDVGVSVSDTPRWLPWKNNVSVLFKMLADQKIVEQVKVAWLLANSSRPTKHLFYKDGDEWTLVCGNRVKPGSSKRGGKVKTCSHCKRSYDLLHELKTDSARIDICEQSEKS